MASGTRIGREASKEPGEAFRSDADDGVGLSVQRERTPHDGSIAAEPPPPEGVAQHDDMMTAELDFGWKQQPAVRGPQTGDVEGVAVTERQSYAGSRHQSSQGAAAACAPQGRRAPPFPP